MRKVLIATPLKGELSERYFQSLFAIVHSGIPDVQFSYCFVSGTSVAQARNEIVKYARAGNMTDLIFWDKDLDAGVPHVKRLLSHPDTAPIVCAMYCKRDQKTYWHGARAEGAEPDPATGLLRMQQSAIGFSLIRMSVFERLVTAFPLRNYLESEGGNEPAWNFDAFPTGLIGPNTDTGKLERIREAYHQQGAPSDILAAIGSILADTDFSGNMMLGEDYYFCRLCRKAGIPIHTDTQMLLTHHGEIGYPIPTEDLQRMLAEPWRIPTTTTTTP